MTYHPPIPSEAQALIASELQSCAAVGHGPEHGRELREEAATYARLTVQAVLDGQPRRAATYAEVANALKEAYSAWLAES